MSFSNAVFTQVKQRIIIWEHNCKNKTLVELLK